MAAEDDVNRILRDHEGYTGDGKGSIGALPVGDKSTAVKPILKRDLREAMTATLGDSYEARDIAVDAAQRAETAAGGVEYPVSYAPGQGLNPTQQQDARDNLGLQALAILAGAANKLPYFDANADAALADLSAFMRGLLAAVDADAARAGIGAVAASDKATTPEAQAGVDDTKWMTPARVADAIFHKSVVSGSKRWVMITTNGINVKYQNTTGNSLVIYYRKQGSGSADLGLSSDGSGAVSTWDLFGVSVNNSQVLTIIPSGWYYGFRLNSPSAVYSLVNV